MPPAQRRFTRYAWGVLAYTVVVILWGGYVRASGSGAGCGSHWPLCNGEIIPDSLAAPTLVELGHRVSSGLLGILVLGMIVAAFRWYPRQSAVRYAAVAVGVFTVIEALIGRGLVQFGYVGLDTRIERAYWMAGHLANTFLLLAVATLTGWLASDARPLRWGRHGAIRTGVAASVLAMLLLGVSGAVTALGDTLALGGLDPAEHPTVAALVGLRIFHPLLAVAVVLLFLATVLLARRRGTSPGAMRWGRLVAVGFALQLGVGLVNVELRAPITVQLIHLLLTDLIWIGLILFAAETLTAEREPVGAVARPHSPSEVDASPGVS